MENKKRKSGPFGVVEVWNCSRPAQQHLLVRPAQSQKRPIILSSREETPSPAPKLDREFAPPHSAARRPRRRPPPPRRPPLLLPAGGSLPLLSGTREPQGSASFTQKIVSDLIKPSAAAASPSPWRKPCGWTSTSSPSSASTPSTRPATSTTRRKHQTKPTSSLPLKP